jgi:hypothetical protein
VSLRIPIGPGWANSQQTVYNRAGKQEGLRVMPIVRFVACCVSGPHPFLVRAAEGVPTKARS